MGLFRRVRLLLRRPVSIGTVIFIIVFVVNVTLLIHKDETYVGTGDGHPDEDLGPLLPDDPKLVQVIRDSFLDPPSIGEYKFTKNLDKLKMKGGDGQPVMVDRILGGKENGFFVEAGAFDGEYLSNSLFFEVRRNWTGLLVEPNSQAYRQLKSKNRKAWSTNACLSINNRSDLVEFESADVYGAIIGSSEKYNREDDDHGATPEKTNLEMLREDLAGSLRFVESVRCFPLFSLLLAVGNPRVDYLSLDVEGSELNVLSTIPFDQVDIRVVSVEVVHSHAKKITQILARNGYKAFKRLKHDIIFVKQIV